GRARQRQHSDLLREAEDDLSRSHTRALHDLAKGARAQLRDIRGQQREALIDDAACAAEAAHVTVPHRAREAAVLHEPRLYARLRAEQLELIERDVAHAEEARLLRVVQLLHRAPDVEIVLRQTMTTRRTMQHIRVDRVDLQMLERARKRLPHLHRDVGVRIVRKAMILRVDVRELRLQEELLAAHAARLDRCADGRFEVMPPLIRGVDAAKAGLDREPHAALRVVFFPGGAVEEGRDHRRHGNLPSFPQHRERGALRASLTGSLLTKALWTDMQYFKTPVAEGFPNAGRYLGQLLDFGGEMTYTGDVRSMANRIAWYHNVVVNGKNVGMGWNQL